MKFKDATKRGYRGVEGLIEWWGKLDDVIVTLKSKKAISHWKKNGIPHRVLWDGEVAPFKIKTHNHTRNLSYEDVTINRLWYKNEFYWDTQERIENVFLECMTMA